MQIAFTYESGERARLSRGSVVPKAARWVPLMNLFNVAIIVCDWIFLRHTMLTRDVIYLSAVIVISLALTVWAFTAQRAQRKRRVTGTTFDLQLTPDGFRGTVDGKPVEIPWKTIFKAQRTADAIVLVQGDPTNVLPIPMRAIDDVDALWKTLDEHLTSARGLMRPPTFTTIYNSAARA